MRQIYATKWSTPGGVYTHTLYIRELNPGHTPTFELSECWRDQLVTWKTIFSLVFSIAVQLDSIRQIAVLCDTYMSCVTSK